MNRARYRLVDNRDARIMIAREVYAEWVWPSRRDAPAELQVLTFAQCAKMLLPGAE